MIAPRAKELIANHWVTGGTERELRLGMLSRGGTAGQIATAIAYMRSLEAQLRATTYLPETERSRRADRRWA